jgi:hypothetical protein
VELVHSAGGGVGHALAQLAPLTGAARIVGTVGRPQRVASAPAAGYDAVLVRDDSLAQALSDSGTALGRASRPGSHFACAMEDSAGISYMGESRRC